MFSFPSGQTYTTQTGYNARGELTQYTYPDGTVVGRSYTHRGELHQLTHAGTTIDTRVYDNGGRQTTSTYNNGVVETRAYDTDNTLTSINFGGSGSAIGNLTYGWDNNHNKTSETITGTMSNYGFTIPTNGYDNEDRLVSFNRTSGLNQSWNLSAVGDWNSVTTNGTAQARTHGPTHELLTGAGQNVSTDVNGNITVIPSSLRPTASSLTSVWDFDNRLVSADVGSNGSVEVSHQYDALGRRVARTAAGSTTIYVQAGQQTIADYVAGAAPAASTYRYVYASYIDEPVLRWQTSGSTALYYHRNQQYSVYAVTNSSGAVQERYAYTAYGVPTIANASGTVVTASAISNRYLYTGREWDSVIHQYHYRARMYDPSLGRFCSRDPITYAGSPWNLFEYVSSKPTQYSDPSGEAPPRSPGGYGNYCGPTRIANCMAGPTPPGTPVPAPGQPAPIDALDAACMIHDCCLWGPKEVIKECLGLSTCNATFCTAMGAMSCGAIYTDPQKLYDCQYMKWKAMSVFCPGPTPPSNTL